MRSVICPHLDVVGVDLNDYDNDDDDVGDDDDDDDDTDDDESVMMSMLTCDLNPYQVIWKQFVTLWSWNTRSTLETSSSKRL